MTDLAEPDQQATLFPVWLADHARGTVADEATAALAELVERVAALGKKGKLTLEFVVEPAGSGGRTVSVVGSVTTKPPIPDPEPSIFFVGERGALLRDDPYRKRLPGMAPRTVEPETGEIHRLED